MSKVPRQFAGVDMRIAGVAVRKLWPPHAECGATPNALPPRLE
jgi:hypothetical protein